MQTYMIPALSDLLHQSSSRHNHLCPRQVLGVRMGLAGLTALHIEGPVTKQTALVIIETDGCFADGIEVATGATVGHRTLRVNDLGKIAATFANVKTGHAVRLSPMLDVRERAPAYAPEMKSRYYAQLHGYQLMLDDELFDIREVVLRPSLQTLISKPGVRITCNHCGEEIINERQVKIDGNILCGACADEGYYLIEAEKSFRKARCSE
jgi:formylmethanofuran dehydrogenase subunit E